MKERPLRLSGSTVKSKTPCGSVYTTINTNGSEAPVEVFCRLGKAGGCASALMETVGRLLSIGLRYGIPVEELAKQLKGIQCHQSSKYLKSCVSSVGTVLAPPKEGEEAEEETCPMN